ncbi:MAG: SGNH/GDSL hydrolase family protein [Candidatus Nanohaloarchaea archaeon]
MQLFAFGHSITYGFWDPEGGWVQRLRSELDEEALESGDRDENICEVFNMGVPGDDSRQLLDRLEDEMEPRLWEDAETIVVFQIGAKDIIYLSEEDRVAVPEEEFRKNLVELVEKARGYADAVILVGEAYTTIKGPIPWAPEKELSDERLERYVEIQRNVCKQEDVPFIDLRSIYTKEEWSEMLEDGSHPDRQGHGEIYRAVRDTVEKEGLLGF